MGIGFAAIGARRSALVRALGNSRSRAQTERERGKAAEVRTCVHLITPDGVRQTLTTDKPSDLMAIRTP